MAQSYRVFASFEHSYKKGLWVVGFIILNLLAAQNCTLLLRLHLKSGGDAVALWQPFTAFYR